jgi:hypothetical protein
MEILFYILKKVPLAFRIYNFIGKIFTWLSTDTPQDIKLKYARKKEKIDNKIKNKYPPSLEDKYSKFNEKIDELALYQAEKFNFIAKRKWGRPNLREAYESAWAYTLSAYFYEKAKYKQKASDSYHYAANGFRNLDAINQAIIHYSKSSELAEDGSSWKSRNENRIRALKSIIGE